jgi:hypothetical protein
MVGISVPSEADGAVIYSGVKNLALPAVGGGQLYLNFVTGQTYPSIPSQTGLDWDIAPYGGGSSNQSSYGLKTVDLAGNSAILAPGTAIGPVSNFFAGPGGSQPNLIPDGTVGIIGFIFDIASVDGFAVSTTFTNYGWFRLEVNAATGGKIVDWAYESTPGLAIAAGAVPEPSALGLLAMGAMGVGGLRRRRAARTSA